MRFLADMGVSPKVVEWLRSNGHDAIHLRDENLTNLSDPEIFAKASGEGRVILTFDLDFGEIAALSRSLSTSVIVFRLRNTRVSHVIARLGFVLDHVKDLLADGIVVTIEDFRHRVRRFPR